MGMAVGGRQWRSCGTSGWWPCSLVAFFHHWPAGEATEVGGDFYDLSALEAEDRWAQATDEMNVR